MERLGLSNFLQTRFNIYMFLFLGWGFARFYIFFGQYLLPFSRGEKQRIRQSVDRCVTLRIVKMKRENLYKVISVFWLNNEKLFFAIEDKKRATQF
jgi:hypothetical protein